MASPHHAPRQKVQEPIKSAAINGKTNDSDGKSSSSPNDKSARAHQKVLPLMGRLMTLMAVIISPPMTKSARAHQSAAINGRLMTLMEVIITFGDQNRKYKKEGE